MQGYARKLGMYYNQNQQAVKKRPLACVVENDTQILLPMELSAITDYLKSAGLSWGSGHTSESVPLACSVSNDAQ